MGCLSMVCTSEGQQCGRVAPRARTQKYPFFTRIDRYKYLYTYLPDAAIAYVYTWGAWSEIPVLGV